MVKKFSHILIENNKKNTKMIPNFKYDLSFFKSNYEDYSKKKFEPLEMEILSKNHEIQKKNDEIRIKNNEIDYFCKEKLKQDKIIIDLNKKIQTKVGKHVKCYSFDKKAKRNDEFFFDNIFPKTHHYQKNFDYSTSEFLFK